jgi:putative DNA-invertase from lambdoid prophage Rac
MATYGYTRVSTAAQATDGESLAVQERTIAGYAMMHGLEVAQTFVERGVSGSAPLSSRPEGKALLARLQPGDVVVTAKLDRMFRSSLDALATLEEFRKGRITLHMIDLGGDVIEGTIGKLVFSILAAVAEAERDRIRERVATVKADQKARGQYLGGRVPFGFRVASGGLERDEAQQSTLESMKALRAAGKSLRAIQSETACGLDIKAINRLTKAA